MTAVETKNLVKRYKDVEALRGINLEIGEGELFGLLGVNGAGKTTLIKILTGLIDPTQGEAFVCGKSVISDRAAIKKICDVSPQETAVAPNLTVEENLIFFAQIATDDRQTQQARVSEIIRIFGLESELKKRARRLSGGWQRRLSVAIALLSDPKVLFLDEPTLGLDVLARRELWNVLRALKGKITMVLTTHYLEEVEALCDRVAVLKSGQVVAVGRVDELKAQTGKDTFEDAFVALVGGESEQNVGFTGSIFGGEA